MSFEIGFQSNVFDDVHHNVCIRSIHCDVKWFDCDRLKPRTTNISNIAS